ncbi:glucose sorbosone dehydrogenase [Actinoplanes sp. SE50]|uniref:PQQ-dependent sugar dehydrogenase n=1 Tax=unclassified Actinoplanes TaxID=2626549 RepID=UPI00023EDF16|nr:MULTISPECIES: PQQ-dependent sugar dehydrogenase [unclassified Actinoplanes]AEV88263.1 glucose sorbosone dehydrogenase [Actinoplanes sp. SE50/110]ATO86668.1 glucose sorbosone dehydrogenase [Actinoplanes sp. SE50]SLM04086.1 glucose sorbosone dehydrogenase [Actinoplanes sp. SE50/110]
MRSRRARAAIATLAVVLALTSGCSFGPPGPDEAGSAPNLPGPSVAATSSADPGEPDVVATVLAKGLDVPWGIAFLPDGSALVTERDTGRILKVGPGSDADGLKVAEAARLPEVRASGDGGLLGIAISPKYASDKTVFVYYSTATDNRIGRLVLGKPLEPILTGIPRSAQQNGGALAFGPDGFLYAGTGDGTTTGTQAPDPKSLGGKILRLTRDGKPAPGNPVKDSPVWSSGHRNVQGITWDKTKRMFATDSTQPKFGELNIVEKGSNYGWPKADGKAGDSKLTDPLAAWPSAESSCGGVAAMESLVATACLLGKRIYLLNVTANGTVLGTPQQLLTDKYGRLRALVAAPDGSLWVSTSNQEDAGEPDPEDDRLIRLVFSDGGAGRS